MERQKCPGSEDGDGKPRSIWSRSLVNVRDPVETGNESRDTQCDITLHGTDQGEDLRHEELPFLV